MDATWISIIVFVCVFGGALFGMFLQRVLPAQHLAIDSNTVIKPAVGLIATLSALVLGLLVSSVHSSFDAKGDAVKRVASQLILLDRTMTDYGSETDVARSLLRKTASGQFAALFMNAGPQESISHVEQITSGLEIVQRDLLKRAPKVPAQTGSKIGRCKSAANWSRRAGC